MVLYHAACPWLGILTAANENEHLGVQWAVRFHLGLNDPSHPDSRPSITEHQRTHIIPTPSRIRVGFRISVHRQRALRFAQLKVRSTQTLRAAPFLASEKVSLIRDTETRSDTSSCFLYHRTNHFPASSVALCNVLPYNLEPAEDFSADHRIFRDPSETHQSSKF